MNETIDSKVGSKPKRGFVRTAGIYLACFAAGYSLLLFGKNFSLNAQGQRYVTMAEEDFRDFSELMDSYKQARQEYLSGLARKAREAVDLNGDGFITRREAGLPPKAALIKE